jgi:nonsense-mediated mRNA decay protein 3
LRGRWRITERSVEQLASEAVSQAVRIHEELQDPEIELDLRPRGSTRYLAQVKVRGRFRDISADDSCSMPVRVRLMACDRCSRMAGKYFEAVVQVRGSSRVPSESELAECLRIAEAMAESGHRSGDRLAFIQDIKEARGGMDLILGSTQLGRQIARAFLERFGGMTQESVKLAGKRDGRDIYRTTILIRLPRLKLGDLVSYRGVLFEVTGLRGRRTLLTSLDGNQRSVLPEEEAERLRVLGNRAEAKRAVVIAKDEKVLEILDPESYKIVLAPRPRSMEVEEGEEVLVVRAGDGFIILR